MTDNIMIDDYISLNIFLYNSIVKNNTTHIELIKNKTFDFDIDKIYIIDNELTIERINIKYGFQFNENDYKYFKDRNKIIFFHIPIKINECPTKEIMICNINVDYFFPNKYFTTNQCKNINFYNENDKNIYTIIKNENTFRIEKNN